MDYTPEDVQWALEIISSPERTAAFVRQYHENPDDMGVIEDMLFIHAVLNDQVGV